jgi:hypothetical protein
LRRGHTYIYRVDYGEEAAVAGIVMRCDPPNAEGLFLSKRRIGGSIVQRRSTQCCVMLSRFSRQSDGRRQRTRVGYPWASHISQSTMPNDAATMVHIPMEVVTKKDRSFILRFLLNHFAVFILRISARKCLTSFANFVTERASMLAV